MRSGADWLTEQANATARAEEYDRASVARELAWLNANLTGIGHLLYKLVAYVQRAVRTT